MPHTDAVVHADQLPLVNAMFAQMQTAVILLNQEGRIEFANHAAARLIESDVASIRNFHYWDFLPPAAATRAQSTWPLLLAGKTHDGEYTLHLPHNQMRFLSYHFVADVLPGLHLFELIDVTNVRQSETTYRALFAGAENAIILYNLDGTIRSINTYLEEQLEITTPEIVGYSLPESESGQQEKILARIQRIVTERASLTLEDKAAERTFLTVMQPVFSQNGEVDAVASFSYDITAQKEAEARLHLMESIVSSSQVIIFCVDENGRIFYANNYAQQKLGYTSEEFLQLDAFQIHANITPAEFKRRKHKILSGKTFITESHLRHKNGQILPVEVVEQAIAFDNKSFFVAFATVITKRLKIRQALQQSEERFRRLYHSSPVPTFLWEHQGNNFVLIDVNNAANMMTNGNAEAFKGRTVAEIYPDRPDIIQDIRTCFADGSILKREVSYQARGTKLERIIIFTYAYVDATLVMMHAQDVTEQRQTEQDLRHRERLYRTLTENLPDIIYRFDHDRRHIYISPRVTEITGIPAEVYLGKTQREISTMSASMIEIWERMLDKVFATGETQESELSYLSNSGQTIFVRNRLIPEMDETGAVSSVLGIHQDVTQLKQEELQQRQRDRLAAVGQMAAGIAHDFNNILAVIVLYAQLLQKSAVLQPEERRRLHVILEQAERAADLIRQILDFSRQSIIDKRPLNMLPLLKEMAKLLQRTLPESIQVSLTTAVSECWIQADLTRIQQVIMNLCFNARDAMPTGGKLAIHLAQFTLSEKAPPHPSQLTPGSWMELQITDSGIGMNADVLPHIFEPFFTTKDPGEGSGLGLAQVYGIIQQHNGSIDVVSYPGKGTTFTIYLPAVDIPQSNDQLPYTIDNLPLGKGESILLVEDHERTRSALSEALSMLNYIVMEAENGAQALEIWHNNHQPIDLIISDFVMEDMDGLELIRQIRHENTQIPIVIISGYMLKTNVTQMRNAGMSDWLPKPVKIKDLAAVILRHLGHTHLT